MKVFTDIERALSIIGHGWTDKEQAHAMAAVIIALRPDVSIELGVYAGKGLVSMALAHKEIGKGIVIGVDPYSQEASAEGQVDSSHRQFWGNLDHEMIYKLALQNIQQFGVRDFVRLVRKKSSEYTPPSNIGLLRIDGNHGEAVMEDIRNYAPRVELGGFLFLDDLGWTGGAVVRAAAKLRMQGWKELYRVRETAVFQKVS